MPPKATHCSGTRSRALPHVRVRQHGREPCRHTQSLFPIANFTWEERRLNRPLKLSLHRVSAVTRVRLCKLRCRLQQSWMRPSLLTLSNCMWEAGGPSSTAATTLAGLHYYKPSWAQYLRKAWRLYRAWLKAEPACRATPMPSLVALGMAGAAYRMGDLDVSVLILLGFDGMLRTGELFQLTKKDIRLVQSKVL
eukprot:6281187-Amphidinium_carterae.1